MKIERFGKLIIYSLISCLNLASIYLSAQETPLFYKLNTNNGLSQNTVTGILQDSYGYYWFGTTNGLNKWNGYDFNVYSNNPNDSSSIGLGRINCIFEESKGELWIGTFQGGLSKYNYKTNNFTTYFNPLSQHHDQRNNILQIKKYHDFLLLGTFSSGLFIFDQSKKTFAKVMMQDSVGNDYEPKVIEALFIDTDSTIWVGHNKGLTKITTKNFSYSNPNVTVTNYLPGQQIQSVYQDIKGKIWIGTRFNGIYNVENKSGLITKFNFGKNSSEMTYSVVRGFAEDNQNNLWIASDGYGLAILNQKTQKLSFYHSELNNNYSLSTNILFSIFCDKQNNMWIGTFNNGINYTNYHKQKFHHIRGFGKTNELNDNSVMSFFEIDSLNILVGTDGGGISLFNPKTKTFTPIPFKGINEELTKNSIITMVSDGADNIYIGTYLKGLVIYNLKTKTFKNYMAGSGEYDLKSNDIWAIAPDTGNTVWVGTLGKGLARLDTKTGKFYNYFSQLHSSQSISDDYISTLLLDHNHKLWIGTHNGGINILSDVEKGIFKKYTSSNSKGLTTNDIWKIFEDRDFNIWIGTNDGGLFLFDNETETFKVYNQKDGLPSNWVKSIVQDHNGYIWVGTNNGLVSFKYHGTTPKFKIYTQHDGLQDNEFNMNAALVTQDNHLLFGGNNGLNYFLTSDLNETYNAGPTVISDFRIINNQQFEGNSQSILNIDRKNMNLIELKHNVTLFTIQYAMLDYISPELNQYKYKLEGFDNRWIDAGTNRSVTYTNLDPGKYTFYVIGTNSQGTENNEPASISIIIKPPFYNTLLFKAFLILLFIALILLIYWLREKFHLSQESLLKDLVEKRTSELVHLNEVLTERSAEVLLQSEELRAKSEHLTQINTTLETSNQLIEKQKKEIEIHRNHLEEKVKARTLELEKAKEIAEESERLKMAFLSNMSHEIRTPMNAIIGFSSLLIEDGFTEEERKNFSNLISSNSRTLLYLIDDILDLSKIEANQLKTSIKPFNIIDVINEISHNWNIIKNENFSHLNFETSVHLNQHQIIINSDSQRIKQIINNLIDNAFKFTQQGSVIVEAIGNNQTIHITVKDTGIGIPKSDHDKIFYRFRKTEESIQQQFRGAGLGLTISKKLSEMLGGNLWVESEHGKGSTFHLELPINQVG